MRVKRLNARGEGAEPDSFGDRYRRWTGRDRKVHVPMVRDPAFPPDAGKGPRRCQHLNREVGPEAAQHDDDHEDDLPPPYPERPAGGPFRNSTRFPFELLYHLERVRVPRMGVVQMADEVLGFHRDLANLTAIHFRHRDTQP